MKFVILMSDVAGTWDALGAEEQALVMKQHGEFRAALEAAGRFVSACHLHPPEEARTVRMDEAGETTASEGCFSGSQEYVGGFYIIEADSREEAVEWATRSRFMIGANEVREIFPG